MYVPKRSCLLPFDMLAFHIFFIQIDFILFLFSVLWLHSFVVGGDGGGGDCRKNTYMCIAINCFRFCCAQAPI